MTPAIIQVHTPRQVAELWLASQRTATSRRTYATSLRDFGRVLGCEPGEAAGHLLGLGQNTANALAVSYRSILQGEGKAPATINGRLSALRSLVEHARRLGWFGWSLDVDALRAIAYRDTRGPGEDGMRRVLAAAAAGPGASRDVPLLLLLYVLALRRAELAGLDLEDVDLGVGVVWIAGKGDGGQRLPFSMPEPVLEAVAAWVGERGSEPGPLFLSRNRALRGAPARLSADGVDDVVRRLGAEVGLLLSPHRLRHIAITASLDATNGDLRAVQCYSRHRDVNVVRLYDDRRKDLAKQVAVLVAARLLLRGGEP